MVGHSDCFYIHLVLLFLCGPIRRILHVFFFSNSSLEVLLQHLSLQDVDAPDNEVFGLTYEGSEI